MSAPLLYAVGGVLGVGCVLVALWAWRLSLRLDGQVRTAARVQAELLAREFAEEVRLSSGATAIRIFGNFVLDPGPWGRAALQRLDASIDSAIACACVRVFARTGGLYAWNSAAGEQLVGVGVDTGRAEALRVSLVRVAMTLGPDETRPVVLKSDAEGRELVGFTLFQRRGTMRRAIGYLSSPQAQSEALFRPAAVQVERARFGAEAREVVAWTLIGPGGDTLVRSGARDPDHEGVSVAFFRERFVPDSGLPRQGESADASRWPYWVNVAVSPRALRARLLGTLPSTPAVLIVVMASALGLAVASIILARRFVAQVREREAFATAVAHDLRTPLTQILLYGESLQLDRPAVRAREEAATIIVRETRRLIHLVENALAFTGRGGAQATLHLAPVDVDAVITETLQSFAPMLATAGMSSALDLESQARVMADRDALVQVVTNLVENAIRFGPAGQSIAVSTRRQGARVTITVDDQGPGVTAGQAEQMFRPFTRGPDSSGIGVGLAVSRQLVELMGGRLFAVSAPGSGARLTCEFPAMRAS